MAFPGISRTYTILDDCSAFCTSGISTNSQVTLQTKGSSATSLNTVLNICPANLRHQALEKRSDDDTKTKFVKLWDRLAYPERAR